MCKASIDLYIKLTFWVDIFTVWDFKLIRFTVFMGRYWHSGPVSGNNSIFEEKEGKLNIFNWVYWRSIGLSLTSVDLLGNMSLLSILPNTSRHCSLLSLFIFTFTLIYFSTTLGCMCLFLSIGST